MGAGVDRDDKRLRYEKAVSFECVPCFVVARDHPNRSTPPFTVLFESKNVLRRRRRAQTATILC